MKTSFQTNLLENSHPKVVRSKKLAVDLATIPSAAWGWSSQKISTYRTVGWVVIGCLLALLKGNHKGHIEDIYLIVIALIIFFFLFYDLIARNDKQKKQFDN